MGADKKKIWLHGQFIEVTDEVYTAYMKGDRSHVSGYAMIRTGKGSEIPPIQKNWFAAVLSVRGAENTRL